MRKLIILIMFLCIATVSAFTQGLIVTGKVMSSVEGEGPLPGVAVTVRGTTVGTSTDIEGNYTIKIPDNGKILVFQFVGMITAEETIGGRTEINISLEPDLLGIDEVVVTALGITREKKTLPYASQDVSSDDLNITSDANIKSSIAGKVAGVQIVGQAGAKLGYSGRIRIRGAISLTSDADPLYVIDGVPTSDPNSIDMDNVASINVLKGPNATALYGQRAEYGVIMITSKSAKAGGVSVEISNNTTFDKVAYLPNYQDEYGCGYDGSAEWMTLDYSTGLYPEEFQVYDGEKFIFYGYADESWGPKFDGSEYIPWYGLWPDSPYYGQTAKWEAQPDNIKDFYNTGVTLKNTVAVSGSGENYSARLAYTNQNQKGILPYSTLNKNLVSLALEYSPTDRLSINGNINFSNTYVLGDFNDSYGNNTTGFFNSWFNRNVDMNKMRELENLKTTHGYSASWNYWGPYLGAVEYGTEKGAFWFNPYFWLNNYVDENTSTRLLGSINANYIINESLIFSFGMSTNTMSSKHHYELPFIIENAADPDFYNVWNSGFGNTRTYSVENNYNALVNYVNQFGDFDLDATAGTTYRTNTYDRLEANMPVESKTQGLVFLMYLLYSNAKLPVFAIHIYGIRWYTVYTAYSRFFGLERYGFCRWNLPSRLELCTS